MKSVILSVLLCLAMNGLSAAQSNPNETPTMRYARQDLAFPPEQWEGLLRATSAQRVNEALDRLETAYHQRTGEKIEPKFYYRVADALGPRDRWPELVRGAIQLRSLPEPQLKQLLASFPPGPDKEVNEAAAELQTELDRRRNPAWRGTKGNHSAGN